MKLPVPLFFDWDKGNKEKNWKKHGVDLKECEQVFFDKQIKFFKDPEHSVTENRFLVYGKTEKKRKLILVFTIRRQKIRIISARDQNKRERRVYETKENSKI